METNDDSNTLYMRLKCIYTALSIWIILQTDTLVGRGYARIIPNSIITDYNNTTNYIIKKIIIETFESIAPILCTLLHNTVKSKPSLQRKVTSLILSF